MHRLRSAERGVTDESGGMHRSIARFVRRKSAVGCGAEVRLLDGHQWFRDSSIVSSDGENEIVEIRCAGYGIGADFDRRMADCCGRRAIAVLDCGWRSACRVCCGRTRLAESSAK